MDRTAVSIEMTVQTLIVDNPVERLRSFLLRDPAMNALLLADLYEPYSRGALWYSAEEADEILAVALVYRGLDIPSMLTFGRPEGLSAILHSFHSEMPARTYALIPLEHREPMNDFFHPGAEGYNLMHRLAMRKGELLMPRSRSVTDLRSEDYDEIKRLLDKSYPGNHCHPSMMEEGAYAGIRDGDDLVCTAGTHVLCREEKICCPGNLCVHPEYRRRGLAAECFAGLLDRLFDVVDLAATNVDARNEASLRTCERVGMRPWKSYFEGFLHKRS